MWDEISLILILMENKRRISSTLKLIRDGRRISMTLTFYIKCHKNKQMEPYGPTCGL